MPWPGLLLLVALAVPGQSPAADPKASAAARSNALGNKMRHAEELLEKGDFKAAEEELKQIAAATPGDARVQYDLGFTEEHNEEDDAARVAYLAAIKADPSLGEARVALGLLEARAGHMEAARTQLEAADALPALPPPMHARILRALARLDAAAKPDLAADELLRATKITGEQPGDAELAAGLAARSGNTVDAEAAYRRTLAQHPDDVAATAGLAGLLQRAGKLPEADAILTPALAAHPDDPQLAAQTAVLYAAEDRNADAIALLTQLRAKDTRAAADPALTRLLAHLDLLAGDAAAAEALYRALVASEPQDPLLLDDFGSSLVKGNKYPEAEAVFSKALGLRSAFPDNPTWGEVAGHLAFAASRNHQPEVALQALAQRATVLPNSPASLFLEATAYDALHRTKQAEQSYRAFLATANGKLPDEEFKARHRLIALEHEH